jgi:hypothetical protein
VELPFRIKFLLSGKLSGYELSAISKYQNVGEKFAEKSTLKIFIIKEKK